MAALSLAGSASCTLLVSTSGLTGSAARDAAAADGPSAVDAAAPVDGGVDAVADGGPFCASHRGATFCADFDQGDARAGWTSRGTAGAGGSLALETTAFISPPASLLARASAGQSSGFGLGVQISKTLTAALAPGLAHLSFDLRLDRADSVRTPQLATIGFRVDARGREPGLRQSHDRDDLDGSQAFSGPMAPEGVSGPSIEFAIGAIYYSSANVQSAAALFDDVLLELR